MKIFLVFLMLPVLLLTGLTGCKSPELQQAAASGGRFSIVTAIFPVYDFARTAAGDSADITLLIKPGRDIHSFDPSVTDIKTINNCDLFIYIGGKSDAWVQKLISAGELNQNQCLRLTDYVDMLEIPEHHREYDEHIWTSPANAKILIQAIAGNLPQTNPDLDIYMNELEELDNTIRDIISAAEHPEIIVADRFALRYFADYYGLSYISALGACSGHGGASPAAIVRIINHIRDSQLKSKETKYIYYAELSDMNIARTIAEETGVELLLLHSAQNVTQEEFTGGAAYLSIMRQNAENLRIGLN